MSHHTARLRNSKLRKDSGCDVRQRRVGRVNRAIAQEHSRNQSEVHAMISTPGMRVALENITGEISENGLPPRPIAAIVADDQVGPLLRIWPLINFAGSIYPRNRRLIVVIAHAEQLFP